MSEELHNAKKQTISPVESQNQFGQNGTYRSFLISTLTTPSWEIMKKKVKVTGKKRPLKSSKKIANKSKTVQKVMVGGDEFCPTCMEWRAYDESTGKCKVCGCFIKKVGGTRRITDEYDLKDFTNDHDEPQETEEF